MSFLTTTLSPERRRWWLRLAVAAQVLFIATVAGAGYATGHFGRVITLRTTPIDPRDLLYGDYVMLNYQISQLPLTQWRGPRLNRRRPIRRGQPVYVELQPTADGTYEAVAVYPHAPARVPASHAVLRGWVDNSWRSSLHIRYGLERYYVPEGTGRALEQQGARRPLRVRVSIAPWSQARIIQVE